MTDRSYESQGLRHGLPDTADAPNLRLLKGRPNGPRTDHEADTSEHATCREEDQLLRAVSYTHLTLPTIYSV